MNIIKSARGLGTFPRLAGAFNVLMVVAVGLVFVVTETTWDRCLAERAGLTPCQEMMMNGQAAIFFLLVPVWILVDLALAFVWLGKRQSAGIRSAPASWIAFGLTVAGLLAMLSLYLPYPLTAPGVVAGFIAMRQSEQAGRRDELAVLSVALGCLGVVVGVGMMLA